jgi:hypothetical protein
MLWSKQPVCLVPEIMKIVDTQYRFFQIIIYVADTLSLEEQRSRRNPGLGFESTWFGRGDNT